MTVASVDGLIAGAQPMRFIHKGTRNLAIAQNRWFSSWPLPGIPGPGLVDTAGIGGSVLSQSGGPIQGAIPFTDPASGKTSHIANLALYNGWGSTMMLCDRLWHNSAINTNMFTAQAINSPAWPARDAFGTSDGFGVMVGLEDTTDAGTGTGTFLINYTNSDGVPGRTASSPVGHSASARSGFINLCNLATGDYGVRSIQSISLSAQIQTAQVSLVAFRILAMVETVGTLSGVMDPASGGLPQLYNGTVPFIVGWAGSGTALVTGHLNVAEG